MRRVLSRRQHNQSEGKHQHAFEPPGITLKCRFWFTGPRLGGRFCISAEFPGDAELLGHGPQLSSKKPERLLGRPWRKGL
jgi:hypothetical protein